MSPFEGQKHTYNKYQQTGKYIRIKQNNIQNTMSIKATIQSHFFFLIDMLQLSIKYNTRSV